MATQPISLSKIKILVNVNSNIRQLKIGATGAGNPVSTLNQKQNRIVDVWKTDKRTSEI